MRNHLFRRCAAALACTSLLTIAAGRSALSSAEAGGPPVAIDFRAALDDGRPVVDLKREDISLKVNGKVREIRSLQLIQFGGPAAVATGASLPPPFASNALSDSGRDVLIAIDDASILAGSEQPVRDAARQLMANLSANDHVGLVAVTQTGPNMAATNQRDAIGAALAKMTGHANASESADDAACRTRVTLDSLKGLFGSIRNGSAATVVFFSSGLTPGTNTEVMVGRTTQTGAGLCRVRTTDYKDVGDFAIASNANFYVVYLTEGAVATAVSTARASTTSNDMETGVKALAGASGAQTIRLADPEGAMARVARETSAYYVATFDPDASERTGTNARVELRVARDGVKVHARPNIMLAKASGAAPKPADMVRVATVFRDLPLRAGGYAQRNGTDEKVKVLAVFESAEPSTKLTSAVIALFDDKGNLAVQVTAEPADLSGATVKKVLPVTPGPGAYRMRVAATDASGRTGTTDYALQAQTIAAPPLKLSALVLGTADGGSFQPRLQFGAAEQAAVGYLEIYGVTKTATVTVSLELASSPDGAAMATTDTTVQATSAEDMRIAFGGFAISALAPGDYLMRAVVSVDGKPVGRSTHTLRKVAQ